MEKHRPWMGARHSVTGVTVAQCRVSDTGPRSRVRNLPPPCCVLEQDTLLPESTGTCRDGAIAVTSRQKLPSCL